MRSSAIKNDLQAMLGTGALVEDQEFERFERGARYGAGHAAAVVRPATTADVSAVLRYCSNHEISVIAQGANTGLVAAATPDSTGAQIVLCLDRLRGIRRLEPLDRVATCYAGTRLSELNAAGEAHDLCLPIDLGADPSLGGMVATNTGGARLIRYGDMRRHLLGLEVVIADKAGTIMSDLKGLRKDNSGIDLKQLFVGTGGTFGIITQIQVELHNIPKQVSTMLVEPNGIAAVPVLVALLESRLGPLLTAVEGMSRNALEASLRHHPTLRNPFSGSLPPEYVMLVEAGTSIAHGNGLDLEEVMGSVLAECLDGPDPLVRDVLVGPGAGFWAIRHAISEGLRAEGAIIAFDISVARSQFPALRHTLIERVAATYPYLRVCDFGHVGDGGVHFNIVWPADRPNDTRIVGELRDMIYDCVVDEFGGSFSAEHGVGPYNLRYYKRYTPPGVVAVAAQLQQIFNPTGALGNHSLGHQPTE